MATLEQTIKFQSNRAYPSIPSISGDIDSHTTALMLMKEALEIHERRTPDFLNSFVRVQELVDLGLITVDGNQLNNTTGGADASGTHNDLSGRTDADAHSIGAITGLNATLTSKLNISASNGPLTGDLGTQALFPTLSETYDFGTKLLSWKDIWANTLKVYDITEVTGGTVTETFDTNAQVIGCEFTATGGGSVVIDMTPASAATALIGATANAAAGQTASILYDGIGGINFGSAVPFTSGFAVTATIQFGVASIGMLNAGTVALTGANNGAINLNGQGGLNVGSVDANGGTITLSGRSQLNTGTVDDGTLILGGDQCFNIAAVSSAGTLDLSGDANVNFGAVVAGTTTMSGDRNFNIGRTATSTSAITMSSIDSINFGSSTSSGDVLIGGSYNQNFMTNNGTGVLDIQAGSIANLSQGRVFSTGTVSVFGIANLARGSLGFNSSWSIGGTNNYVSNFSSSGGTGSISAAFGCFVSGCFFDPIGLGKTFTITGFGQALLGFQQNGIDLTGGSGNLVSLYTTDVGFGIANNVVSGSGNLVTGYQVAGLGGRWNVTGNGNLVLMAAIGNSATPVTDNVVTNTGTGTIQVVALDINYSNVAGTGNQAFGYTDTGVIDVTAASNASQFYPGTNNQSNLLQVGGRGAGISIYGLTADPSGGLVNGMIWNRGANGVRVRSNAVTIILLQQGATGASGYAAVGGTNVNSNDTFTGGVGATAYTIGDIVAALKNMNILVN